MGHIAHRALARDPRDRYATAEAMAAELCATLLLDGIAAQAHARPLRRSEEIIWRLGRLYVISLRALLEGNREESLQACEELRKATFRDPEGIYYLARQLSYLGEQDWALETLSRAIKHGFFCYPAMVRDPWLHAVRTRPEFTALLRQANDLQREATAAFAAGGGETRLGLRPEAY